jgi:hypothetical protein
MTLTPFTNFIQKAAHEVWRTRIASALHKNTVRNAVRLDQGVAHFHCRNLDEAAARLVVVKERLAESTSFRCHDLDSKTAHRGAASHEVDQERLPVWQFLPWIPTAVAAALMGNPKCDLNCHAIDQ